MGPLATRESNEGRQQNLTTIGNFKFGSGGAVTDDQHLEVILSGISSQAAESEYQDALDYAKNNISDPSIVAEAYLAVANANIEGINHSARDLSYTRIQTIAGMTFDNEHRHNDKSIEENAERFVSGLAILIEVASMEDSLDDTVHSRTYELVRDLQEIGTEKYVYNPHQDDSENEKAKGREKGAEFIAETSLELSRLALQLIGQAEQTEDPAEILGEEPYIAYEKQINFIGDAKTVIYGARISDENHLMLSMDEMAIKAKEAVSVDNPDAVDFCLRMTRNWNVSAVVRRQFMEKALEITGGSDRSHPKRKSIFGFKIGEKISSVFEQRRHAVERHISNIQNDQLYGYIEEWPDLVAKTIGLFGVEKQEKLWRSYGAAMAKREIFSWYTPEGLELTRRRMDSFATVAPARIVEETKEILREAVSKAKLVS